MDIFGTLFIFGVSYYIRYINLINKGIPLCMILIGILYPCILLAIGHTQQKIFGCHLCASFFATNRISITLGTGLGFNMKTLGIKICMGN